MSRSYSKIRHMQQSNLMLENRMFVEKSRKFLTEQIQGDNFNIEKYVVPFITSVQAAFPSYIGQKIESGPQGATLFGQYLYTLPVRMPEDKQKIISNLNKIYNMVVEKGVRGKELQSTCVPRITKHDTVFPDGNYCFAFQNTNKTSFPKYSAMNTAFNNLINYINSLNVPTQK